MNGWITVVFLVVYLGLLLGKAPFLRMDRTGIALLGAIVLLASGAIGEHDALAAVDVPTIALLFGLMVVSAQLHLSGFYSKLTLWVHHHDLSPRMVLAVVTGLSGLLSALLTNDVVCVALAPLLMNLCAQRQLNPVPYLLALACAANIGSAATVIGNPQVILVGETLDLPFLGYMLIALPVVLAGLVLTWALLWWAYRHRIEAQVDSVDYDPPKFNAGQTIKGLIVLSVIVLAFLFSPWPRELVALGGAGVLLLSRHFHERQLVSETDWPLLVLFISLFIVNAAFHQTGELKHLVHAMEQYGVQLSDPPVLFVVTPILGNLVSNVPAIMLLLPLVDGQNPLVGPVLALSSTLAGNLIIVGSVANIIVVETAARSGVKINFKTHAKVGVPIALSTLVLAAGWLWLLDALGVFAKAM